MKAFFIAPALLVSIMAFSPAVAAPVAPFSGASALESPMVQIQYGRDRDDHRRYRAGQRYRNAPQGWHRYDRRPGDWRARRCGQVGPVWFCP
jgi:hypothetical protein